MDQQINIDQEFCGKVPLHQTNLIQPHGFLLIVDKADFMVVQASENVDQLFNKNVKSVVRTLFTNYVGKEDAARLDAIAKSDIKGKVPLLLSFTTGKHLGLIQVHPDYLIIEIEKQDWTLGQDNSFLAIYQEVKYIMSAIDACATIEETCLTAIRALKKISGFDKIMIYRFDENWNGDVIAEIKEGGMESYLGLKFPASDIPKQARELYRKMPYRLIPNVDYEPVRLFPVINPLTNAFIDLSDSNLRSVAGVHLEYLKNMNVAASMSTRILKDNELWGLISCHHRTARYLSFEMCSVFELLSGVISSRLSALKIENSFSWKSKMQELYTGLMEDMLIEDNLPLSFHKSGDGFLQLLGADSAALILNNQVHSIGNTPSENEINELIIWLQSKNTNGLVKEHNLAGRFEPAEKYANIASGVLALPILPEKGSFILAFRQEAVRKVNWGGNPNNAINFESDGKTYHPRNSFKLWQQAVHETSLPWEPEELEIAERLRNFVVDFVLNRLYS